MIKINIKNPISDSIIFTKSLVVRYETTGSDVNFNKFLFLINGQKYENSNYYGFFSVDNLNIGKNEIIYYTVNKNNKKIINTENRIIFEVKEATVVSTTPMSLFCKMSIPDFIKDDYASFTNFIQKYYKFLETSNVPYLVPYAQSDFIDIDTTSDYFKSYFKSQFLSEFPQKLGIDRQTGNPLNLNVVIKNIKRFYEAKGTLDSFKFLFRMLYDTEIDIKYPREKIIKTSSSKWIRRKSIKIFSFNDNLSTEINNRFIYQLDENGNRVANARVSDVEIYRIDQYKVAELFLEDYTGTFDIFRKIYCDSVILGANETLAFYSAYCPKNIEIVFGGYNYKINDLIKLRPVQYVSVDGVFYGSQDYSLWDEGDLNIGDIDGQTLNQYLNNLPDTDTTIYDLDGFSFSPFPEEYWTFDSRDFGFTFRIPGMARTKGKGYLARVSEVGPRGEILKIDPISFGFNYESRLNNLYVIDIETDKGVAFNGNLTYDLICEYSPYYSGSKNLLGYNSVLQDNFYYQSHSYEIQSEIDIVKYEANVKKLVHPVGYKMFGKNVINKKNINTQTHFSQISEIT